MIDFEPEDNGTSDPEMNFSRNKAWSKSESYQTSLDDKQENKFLEWVKNKDVPFDLNEKKPDYDMRGFWKALQEGDPKAQSAINKNDNKIHFPDYWKTPYHKSFSNESKYATKDAPRWNGSDQLITTDGKVIFDESNKGIQFEPEESIRSKESVTPDKFATMSHHNPAMALGSGALKGVTDVAWNMRHLLAPQSSLMENIQGQPMQNPAANVGAEARKSNPMLGAIGEFAGGSAPLFALPEVKVFQGLEALAGKAISSLGNSLTGKAAQGVGSFLSKPLTKTIGNNAALGAAVAPVYNPDSSPLESMSEGAVLGGVLPTALSGAPGLVARGWNSLFKNFKTESKKAGNAYRSIRDEANAAGFTTVPEDYKSQLSNVLTDIKQEGSKGVNKILEKDLNERLNVINEEASENPDLFTVKGTHSQIRQLSRKINNYTRKGNYDAARIYSELKNSLEGDLVSSLQKQNLPHLADQFMKAQKNYAENVAPLRKLPVSKSHLAAEAALIGSSHFIPGASVLGPLMSLLGASLVPKSSLSNVRKRFFGDYQGGLSKSLRRFEKLDPYLLKLLAPHLNLGTSTHSKER